MGFRTDDLEAVLEELVSFYSGTPGTDGVDQAVK